MKKHETALDCLANQLYVKRKQLNEPMHPDDECRRVALLNDQIMNIQQSMDLLVADQNGEDS